MCGYCGCSQSDGHGHEHSHDHAHQHSHRIIEIEQDILAENQRFADQNRQYLREKNILAFNLVSSPGAGKTTLLVETLQALKAKRDVCVIEGDQQTDRDAQRIAKTGANVLQINTGKACHLDAHRISHGLSELRLKENSLLFIENVGNLVCPALFDLGENCKVVILSVTEGDDKPLKYPYMFHEAQLMIINKIDLLPYVSFDINQCIAYAKRDNPNIEVLQVSATTGENLSQWYEWLTREAIHV